MSFLKVSIGIDTVEEEVVLLLPHIVRPSGGAAFVSSTLIPRACYLSNVDAADAQFICDAINEKLERDFCNGST